MRIWPRSLAGRLAGLLILTLVVAQSVAFLLFAGERIAAFRIAYRDDIVVRIASLVALIEATQPDLHGKLVAATNSRQFRIALGAEPIVAESARDELGLHAELVEALHKPESAVRVSLIEGPRRRMRDPREATGDEPDVAGPDAPPGPPGRRIGRLRWLGLSVELSDGRWLNATADRPPIPPLGRPFLVSFLISAAAVGLVGALGVRWASSPLRRLASAADRLGRGEDFEPLPEKGPEETRHANMAFNRMRERLERYVRDRTAMLGAIAHDLRTPITTLRLRAEFIEDEDIKARILETLAEMQAMAEAVLSFARRDSESETSRPTDLTALVESIVEDVAASGRDARFEESPPVTLSCRPFALKRAIGNLIDNAVFYGGRARVAVEPRDGAVRIRIDDDGPGIPAADLERVFEPFVRLEGSRSRDTGGAGLGLAIARSILRAHGGDVTLDNRPEGGLRATATLPL